MKIVHLDGFSGRCEAKGIARDVNFYLLQSEPIAVGDYVLVHVGYAIQKMTPQDARSTWELFDAALNQEGPENREDDPAHHA